MTDWIALLRGVNVGGITIKMADLADLVRGLGFTEVRTVLASGNVLFDAPDAAGTVKERLETALRERFGYEAWVHVLRPADVRAVVDGYPLERARDGWHDYAMFVMRPEVRDELLAVPVDPAVEQVAPGPGVVYWTVPKGSTLDSAVGKATSVARYKPWLTTRNLNTLDKLLR